MQPERKLAPADDRVAMLAQVEIFSDLKKAPKALQALAGLMREENYRAGQAILTEGEAGSELYVLIQGEASVNKSTAEGDRYRVAVLKSQGLPVVGEGGLLGSDARSATICAEGACRCLVLRRDDFERFATEYPEWGMPVVLKIARAVMGRLHKANEDLTLLYNALVAEIRGK